MGVPRETYRGGEVAAVPWKFKLKILDTSDRKYYYMYLIVNFVLFVPKIDKIVVNCGIGDAAQNSQGLDAAINAVALITGQRPVKTKAKNAIATFKIRENQTLGIEVTLGGNCWTKGTKCVPRTMPSGMDVCITTAQTDKEAFSFNGNAVP
ncbi:hypothetical protein L1987_59001 [Smallanthus sonchifolius]|uniref:Uncharacterized protein n=1 Tax=Smallanthus sonchifolius TaxID=185202 RepID=A0ACB9D431_9ASTR|nr:hypothetical protein L1987_59001 [Smallanthus sonchifolius]